MQTHAEKNKRIAKNTLLLYGRLMVTMIVSLYTSRVVLATLGVDDFGIYNVVGGVVAMFAVLNGAMASATQRFLAFHLGRGDDIQLRKTFNATLVIHLGIALLIVLLAETLGYWFLEHQLVIPDERMAAARWVFHAAVVSFAITVIQVPFTAVIIAHEHMSTYAYVSVLDVVLKLLIVLLLVRLPFDALIAYAVLLCLVAFLVLLVYVTYVRRHFRESAFERVTDKALYKTLLSYSGWNLFGGMASVVTGQGINILLNLFFGPALNAARGVAFQVHSAVNGFVINFQLAINPQIMKSYAVEEYHYMHQLIFRGSKYSFFLLFILVWPLLLETSWVLDLWLKDVPDYAVLFTQLVLINALIDSLSGSLMTAAQATGRIRKYQTLVGSLLIANLPLSYLFLTLGAAPQAVFYVGIGVSVAALALRLQLITRLVCMKKRTYLTEVVLRIAPVILLTVPATLFLQQAMTEGWGRFILLTLSAEVLIGLSLYLIGLNRQEKAYLHDKIGRIAHLWKH